MKINADNWLLCFYAMVAGDFCRYYFGMAAVFIYLAIGIVGIIARERYRNKNAPT